MIKLGISGFAPALIPIGGDLGVPSHFRFLGVKTGGGGDQLEGLPPIPEPPTLAESEVTPPEPSASPPPPVLTPKKRKWDGTPKSPSIDIRVDVNPDIPELIMDQPSVNKQRRTEREVKKGKTVTVRTVLDDQTVEIRIIQRPLKNVKFTPTNLGSHQTRRTAPPVPEGTTRMTRSGSRVPRTTVTPEEVAIMITQPKKEKGDGRPVQSLQDFQGKIVDDGNPN